MSRSLPAQVRPAQQRSASLRVKSHLRDLPRKGARLCFRAARSIIFRTQRTLSVDRLRRLKRDVLFPLRNTLFRDRPISVSATGQTFFLKPNGAVAIETWAGLYAEWHELNLVLDALNPGAIFFDIGANAGLFSIPAAGRLRQTDGRVFAFEPTEHTYQILLQNISLNQASNVQPFHCAIGDYVGQATLQVNVPGKDGLNTLGKPVHWDSEIASQQTVPVTTLDHFIEQNFVPRADVMKVDVEGAELLVLRGARNLLSRVDAPLVVLEISDLTAGFGYHPVEILWFLRQYGYHLFAIDSSTGRISALTASPTGHAMLIASKSGHPFYAHLQDRSH